MSRTFVFTGDPVYTDCSSRLQQQENMWKTTFSTLITPGEELDPSMFLSVVIKENLAVSIPVDNCGRVGLLLNSGCMRMRL